MARRELLRLVRGFRQFREKFYLNPGHHFSRLTHGWQGPKTLVIGCCDSRVDPAILTSADPGDLFVVRNVANLVPHYESDGGVHGVSAAIEFAVVNLKVDNVVILGHRQCGGIRALMYSQDSKTNGFVHQWMKVAEPAKVRTLAAVKDGDEETMCRRCEMESIRTSLENLRTFPFVMAAIQERNMELLGVYFDIEKGELLELNEKDGSFFQIMGSESGT